LLVHRQARVRDYVHEQDVRDFQPGSERVGQSDSTSERCWQLSSIKCPSWRRSCQWNLRLCLKLRCHYFVPLPPHSADSVKAIT
jgi:hypothetical protein